LTMLGLSRKIATILVIGHLVIFLVCILLMFLPTNVAKQDILQMALTNGPLAAISLAAYSYVMRMISRGNNGALLQDNNGAFLTTLIVAVFLVVEVLLIGLTLVDPAIVTAEDLQTATGIVSTMFGAYLAVIKDTLFPSPPSARAVRGNPIVPT
jgi:hypothetical protein